MNICVWKNFLMQNIHLLNSRVEGISMNIKEADIDVTHV